MPTTTMPAAEKSLARSAAAQFLVKAISPGSLAVASAIHSTVVLYRVGANRVARVVAVLRAPPATDPLKAHEVALSGGSHPDTCVLWGAHRMYRLICYPFATTRGVVEASYEGAGDMVGISLSRDGAHLAWITRSPPQAAEERIVLVTARLARGRLTDQQRFPSLCWPYQSSWMGSARLLVACNGANDAQGGYETVNVATHRGKSMPEHHRGGFNEYLDLQAYSPRLGVAIEHEYCDITCPTGRARQADRAVRVDLLTGSAVAVLAYPADGRSVMTALGGSDGVLYSTAPLQGVRGPSRTYLRFAGDPDGAQVSGLKGWILGAQP